MVASCNRASTACRICSADVTCVTSDTPLGPVAAVIRMTCAPRADAISASAWPIFPLDRLPMKRTGSIISRVPPAVIRMVSSARSWVRRSIAITAAAIVSTAAKRPVPVMPQARSPASGSMMVTPRSRRRWRFSCMAGCSHICTFIAGARSTGARVAR